MPKTVFIIRHGEKPQQADDVHLSPQGYQRAAALSALFDAKRNGATFPTIDALFATACSKQSHRPVLTLRPLSGVLGIDINDKFGDKHYGELAALLLAKGSHDGKRVLVCWHHGEIPALAGALKATQVPAKWPEDRFDLVWRLDYDKGGSPSFNILPQLLLYGDGPVGAAC